MTLKIYGDMMSQPTRAVLLFCKENNIPFTFESVQITRGQTRTAEFRAVNPFGKVPAMDDNGFKLNESHAMMQYLARTYNVAEHWYPSDPKRRAHVQAMCDYHHTNVRMYVRNTL
jgi:glutathione S-transferase